MKIETAIMKVLREAGMPLHVGLSDIISFVRSINLVK